MNPFDVWMKQLGQAADKKQADPKDDLPRRLEALGKCVGHVLDAMEAKHESLAKCVDHVLSAKKHEVNFLAEVDMRLRRLEAQQAPQSVPVSFEEKADRPKHGRATPELFALVHFDEEDDIGHFLAMLNSVKPEETRSLALSAHSCRVLAGYLSKRCGKGCNANKEMPK